jgi:DMSO/TMAO reductase YedYZ molybdopterin-dependent catalytic subunit
VDGIPADFSYAELDLASRNHALLLEALRYPVTPVGLHYLLNHFDVPQVDPAAFRLEVDGLVGQRLSLTLEEVVALPAVELTVTLECAGNGRATLLPRPRTQPWLTGAVGTATWKGAPLAPLLAEAGLRAEAVEVVFAGCDRGIEGGIEQDYRRSLPVADAVAGDALLAYEVNGLPLPPQHGYPLRLVVPGWYGMASVKWLTKITPVAEPFEGYYQVQAYCVRQHADDAGEQITRMLPRALMAPPGIAEFPSRHRFVDRGPCVIEGRAWSGFGPVEAVEVSTDGGSTWLPATLERDLGEGAWSRWRFDWLADRVGDRTLCCRARDRTGREQPLDQAWNHGGYVNNAVQRVPVTVR